MRNIETRMGREPGSPDGARPRHGHHHGRGGFGPGGFGPGGFGPGGFGPGPDGPRRRHGGRGRGRGRASRGDVRTAVLLLLAEEPMHGYQLMQAIGDRSGGRWTPSPGAVYPTINQLEDEGLVTVTAQSGRRLVTLTDAGRQAAQKAAETDNDPFVDADGESGGVDLRTLIGSLMAAVHQVNHAGTPAQRQAAATVLTQARRSLYLLLADDTADETTPADGTS